MVEDRTNDGRSNGVSWDGGSDGLSHGGRSNGVSWDGGSDSVSEVIDGMHYDSVSEVIDGMHYEYA